MLDWPWAVVPLRCWQVIQGGGSRPQSRINARAFQSPPSGWFIIGCPLGVHLPAGALRGSPAVALRGSFALGALCVSPSNALRGSSARGCPTGSPAVALRALFALGALRGSPSVPLRGSSTCGCPPWFTRSGSLGFMRLRRRPRFTLGRPSGVHPLAGALRGSPTVALRGFIHLGCLPWFTL